MWYSSSISRIPHSQIQYFEATTTERRQLLLTILSCVPFVCSVSTSKISDKQTNDRCKWRSHHHIGINGMLLVSPEFRNTSRQNCVRVSMYAVIKVQVERDGTGRGEGKVSFVRCVVVKAECRNTRASLRLWRGCALCALSHLGICESVQKSCFKSKPRLSISTLKDDALKACRSSILVTTKNRRFDL